jgi:hypothetical protein
LRVELADLRGLALRSRHAALVLAGGLGRGDPLTLTFEHQFALEFGCGAEDTAISNRTAADFRFVEELRRKRITSMRLKLGASPEPELSPWSDHRAESRRNTRLLH